MNRRELNMMLGGAKVTMPPYVNFDMPLSADSDFGYKLTVNMSDNGNTVTNEEYLHNGASIPFGTFVKALHEHNDKCAKMRNHDMVEEGRFDGVAFGLVTSGQ